MWFLHLEPISEEIDQIQSRDPNFFTLSAMLIFESTLIWGQIFVVLVLYMVSQ